jgi:hypothetical protein
MFKSVIANSVTAITVATLVAGFATFLTSTAPQALAASAAKVAVHQPSGKANRLPARVLGSECSSRSWPNYEQSCQFDRRRPADELRTVRIIPLR